MTAAGTLVQAFTFTQATGSTTDPGAVYNFNSPTTARYLLFAVNTAIDGLGNFSATDPYTGISEIGFFSVGGTLPATNINVAGSGATLTTAGTVPSGTSINLSASGAGTHVGRQLPDVVAGEPDG